MTRRRRDFPSPAPELDNDGVDHSWRRFPYQVLPVHVEPGRVHLAVSGEVFVERHWGDTSRLHVRTACGCTNLYVERGATFDSWPRVCLRCFPPR